MRVGDRVSRGHAALRQLRTLVPVVAVLICVLICVVGGGVAQSQDEEQPGTVVAVSEMSASEIDALVIAEDRRVQALVQDFEALLQKADCSPERRCAAIRGLAWVAMSRRHAAGCLAAHADVEITLSSPLGSSTTSAARLIANGGWSMVDPALDAVGNGRAGPAAIVPLADALAKAVGREALDRVVSERLDISSEGSGRRRLERFLAAVRGDPGSAPRKE